MKPVSVLSVKQQKNISITQFSKRFLRGENLWKLFSTIAVPKKKPGNLWYFLPVKIISGKSEHLLFHTVDRRIYPQKDFLNKLPIGNSLIRIEKNGICKPPEGSNTNTIYVFSNNFVYFLTLSREYSNV